MSDADRREVPALLVEQLALGELDEAQAAAVRARLDAGSEGADETLAALAAEDAEILGEHPPERVAAEIERRLARLAESESESGRSRGRGSSRRGLWIGATLTPALAAAALLLWLVPDWGGDAGDDASGQLIAVAEDVGAGAEGETTRIKGGASAHLVVDRKTEAGHERLGEGEAVRAGDLLQLSYVPAGARRGVILSIDGAGVVTLHHPSVASGDTRLQAGREIPLGESYLLDDAPGYERFVLVTREGDRKLSADEVIAAAERIAGDPRRARSEPLPLAGAGWRQSSLVLRKAAQEQVGGQLEPVPAEGEGAAR
ncbi:hypothetical protein G6O69_28105 [Pseudenhygromyxa sp. WMMC2535]|uniref:hypothetical protein n=1 Tax=Pseudenhygromyxa sp. WMMC2535 TaxID=2712867 RepID=UPI001556A0BB|nr:hypothetical protein [Pseudenhygromyxa sp. WMMC2535]NVB41730.1 hypothetical protein [Pseudenhygromyxa sp. WMMC2535]